jgi:hypothetical protein
MKKTWENHLGDIRSRVLDKERLTVQQGAMLLQEYEGCILSLETLSQANREWQARYEALSGQLEDEQEALSRRARELNAMYDLLHRLFGIEVYSRESDAAGELLWTAEWRGKKTTGHLTVAAAYETAIIDILTSEASPA